MKQGLLDAQQRCFAMGLTTIDSAAPFLPAVYNYLRPFKGGIMASLFLSSVIKGLLARYPVLLILLKQLPHVFGHSASMGRGFSFNDPQGGNTFTHLQNMIHGINWSAFVIALVSILILIYWEKISARGVKQFPAPLFVALQRPYCSMKSWLTSGPTWPWVANT